jgi:hypothetical protein
MQLRRTHRSRFALATAALALAAPVLTSCGFDYATDRVYTPATGTNDRDGVVDVLGAAVVSTDPGSGTFVATLSNNSDSEPVTLEEISSTGATEVTAGDFEPVEVEPGGVVNLADPAAEIELTGDFEAGNFVELALSFDNGERTVLEVVVVENSGYYADLDGPAPAEETSETPETESSH